MEEDLDEAQVGRILHFVTEIDSIIQCRPAIVISTLPNQGKPGCINLSVWLDEGQGRENFVYPNHAVKAFGTWHWPRGCESLEKAARPFEKFGKRTHHNHGIGIRDMRNCYACLLIDSMKDKENA